MRLNKYNYNRIWSEWFWVDITIHKFMYSVNHMNFIFTLKSVFVNRKIIKNNNIRLYHICG